MEVALVFWVPADDALPVPVPVKEHPYLLDGHLLGLRQQEDDEDGHDDDERGEEHEDAPLEVAQRGEEALRHGSRPEEVDTHHHALPRRPHLQREQLARHQPSQGPPGPSVGHHEEADGHHQHRAHALAQLLAFSELEGKDHSHHDHGGDHLNARLDEEEAAAEAVDGDHGDERADDEHGAGDDGGVERRGGAEPKALEDDGRVEEDGVHARQLLERRDAERADDELRAVAHGEQVPERARDGARGLAGLLEVLELGVHLVRAAHLLQHAAGLLQVPALDEAVGRLGKEERADEDGGGGAHGEAQREAPPPGVQAVGEVVDDVGDEDAEAGGELEQLVHGAADAVGRDLREVERHGLVAEADADAEEHAADDEHGDVHGGRVDGAAEEEAGGAHHDAGAPAVALGHVGGAEGGDEAREVERRGEERQHLVVVLAVVRLVQVRLLPPVHVREELHQEVVHGSHAAGDSEVIAEEGSAEGADDASEDEVAGDLALVELGPPGGCPAATKPAGHLAVLPSPTSSSLLFRRPGSPYVLRPSSVKGSPVSFLDQLGRVGGGSTVMRAPCNIQRPGAR